MRFHLDQRKRVGKRGRLAKQTTLAPKQFTRYNDRQEKRNNERLQKASKLRMFFIGCAANPMDTREAFDSASRAAEL
jgi:hypothetical protein